ncbi:MAG: hypothetical protein JWP49_2639 [Phenylobacterium sp.]|nr:hypothetical protein [Phenylobacterium sp.]
MRECTIDWQATAAWAQAVLTALAVFLAAYLQDRSLQRRERADLNRRIESAAFAARWAWSVFEQLRSAVSDGMDPDGFRETYLKSDWYSANRIARSVAPLDVRDEILAGALLRLDLQIARVDGVLNEMISSTSPNARNVATALKNESASLFNALANVERRAAILVGRPAKL